MPDQKKMNDSRYTYEILNTAYKSMWDYRGVATLTIPVNHQESDVEVYFHVPKEIADLLMDDLFMVISKIDIIVQGDDTDNFDIAYFNVYGEIVKIGYFSNKVNTEFDVTLFQKDKRWFISDIGIQKCNPPIEVEEGT